MVQGIPLPLAYCAAMALSAMHRVSEGHCPKALSSMEVIEAGMSTVASCSVRQKAPSPISVTLPGMTTVVSLQPLKASSPMRATPSGML